MSSLRETKNRIRSVKNTEKITKAMKMVAASKLRRAQEAVVKPRAFTKKLEELVVHLSQRVGMQENPHPLLLPRQNKKKAHLLVLTSDRGLCGALNSSVLRATQNFLVDHKEQFEEISISSIGKKGFEGLFRLGLSVQKHYLPNKDKVYDFNLAQEIAHELCEQFLEHKIDCVFLVYNHFKSAITQEVISSEMLPIKIDSSEPNLSVVDFIYEPKAKDILDGLIAKHFATKLYQAFLESYASEQGARMTAMDNATRNAKEMTDRLTLQYNRARQAAITKELMEIIGGAEAL